MKKCFTMLLSVGLAGICAIGIAACGGASSAKNIISDIVTQEEWEAAFAEENFENFKLEATRNSTEEWWVDDKMLQEESWKMQRNSIVVCENENLYENMYVKWKNAAKSESLVDEHYYDFANGLEYIKDENNQWSVSPSEYNKIGSLLYYYLFAIDIDEDFHMYFPECFDLFEYSEKEKGYLYEYREQDEGDHENIFRLILKFKEGKLAGCYVSADIWGLEEADHHTKGYFDLVVTYGGQHVTLPEVSEAE